MKVVSLTIEKDPDNQRKKLMSLYTKSNFVFSRPVYTDGTSQISKVLHYRTVIFVLAPN